MNWSYTINEEGHPHNGKTLWSGRYCAVAAFIFCIMQGKVCVLANQRGKGTPDFQGLWNCPCGFLEDTESGEQGCARETYEETGVKVNPSKFTLIGVETDPEQCNNGNVTLRYTALLKEGRDDVSVSKSAVLNGNGEKDEVESIGWIPIDDIDSYEWAFNHKKRIMDIVEYFTLKTDGNN